MRAILSTLLTRWRLALELPDPPEPYPMVKAVFIDPYTETIVEVDNDGGLQAIRTMLQLKDDPYQGIDAVGLLGGQAMLYVDDEGLFRDDQEFFLLAPGMAPIAGRGLIYGLDSLGDNVDHPFILDRIRAGVSFPDIEFAGMDTTEGTIEHPMLGRTMQILHVSRFRNKADGTTYHIPEPPEGFADDTTEGEPHDDVI